MSMYNLVPAIQEIDCESFCNSKGCVGQRRVEGRNCPVLDNMHLHFVLSGHFFPISVNTINVLKKMLENRN